MIYKNIEVLNIGFDAEGKVALLVGKVKKQNEN